MAWSGEGYLIYYYVLLARICFVFTLHPFLFKIGYVHRNSFHVIWFDRDSKIEIGILPVSISSVQNVGSLSGG